MPEDALHTGSIWSDGRDNYGEEDNSWIPKLWAEGCAEKVDDFW